jgi:hypothetical protein
VTLAEWVSAALTGVTALATLVLAAVTWLLWKSTQRMAAATSEPFVVATLEPSRWAFVYLELHIENTGTGPAFDVQISFDPPLLRDASDSLTNAGNDHNAPLNALSILRPSQSFRDPVGRAGNLLANDYRVTVSWRVTPQSRDRVSTSYDLDLSQFKSMMQLGGGDPLVKVAEEMTKLRDRLEPILRGAVRLDVDVYTQEERERERAAQVAAFERMRAQHATPKPAPAKPPPKSKATTPKPRPKRAPR